LGAGADAWIGDEGSAIGSQDASPGHRAKALADFGTAGEAPVWGLLDLSSGAGTALGQHFVLPWTGTFSWGPEASIGARSNTEETRSGGGAAGDEGAASAAGHPSVQETSAEEPAGLTPGPEEEEPV